MGEVISTRNGVPPVESSDPPGGVPRQPDPDVRPHQTPTPADPEPGADLPEDAPPPTTLPPSREAKPRSHHARK